MSTQTTASSVAAEVDQPLPHCQRCNSPRLLRVSAYAKDQHYVSIPYLDFEHEGYFMGPSVMGYSDAVDIVACLDCGQLQGEYPTDAEKLKKDVEEAKACR